MQPDESAKLSTKAMIVLKKSAKLQSFVVEETGLADLLERAWRPVRKKLLEQLHGSIDFKSGKFRQDKAINFELWVAPDMYNEALNKQWASIEPQVKKYIEASYLRAWSEKGGAPSKVLKTDEEWDELWAELDGATEQDKDKRTAGKVAIAAAMLVIARDQFVNYAEHTVIPSISDSLTGLRKLSRLEEELRGDLFRAKNGIQQSLHAAESVLSAQAEEAGIAMALTKLQETRTALIGKLNEVLEGARHAAGTANITVARAHHFGFLDWAVSNSVQYYQVVALLEDDRTCQACRDMHGKIFAVRDAVAFKEKFLDIVGDKERMKEETPFLTAAAAKEVSGYTIKKAAAFYFPQFHPHCRCTVIAVHEDVE